MKEKQQMELQEKRQRNIENRIYQMQISISNFYKKSKKLFDSGNSVNDRNEDELPIGFSYLGKK